MNAVLYALLLMNLCWIYFLAVMHLRDAKDAGRLTGFARTLGYVNLIFGLLLDVAVNLLPMTFILLELPRPFDREWLTTARLSRHIRDGDGWRRTVALWFCRTLLSTFDSTQRHCGE